MVPNLVFDRIGQKSLELVILNLTVWLRIMVMESQNQAILSFYFWTGISK